jgi:hypothetical protein
VFCGFCELKHSDIFLKEIRDHVGSSAYLSDAVGTTIPIFIIFAGLNDLCKGRAWSDTKSLHNEGTELRSDGRRRDHGGAKSDRLVFASQKMKPYEMAS